MAFVKMRWNNWRFKRAHMFMLITGWLSLVAFQFLMTYFDESDIDYFGLSAVWLNLNFSILSIGFFLNLNTLTNLTHVMKTYRKEKGPERANDRTESMQDELNVQRNDPDWFPTANELGDICSIGRINNRKMM
jgi:hypothetical protein